MCSMAVEILTSIWSKSAFVVRGTSNSTTTAMAQYYLQIAETNINLLKADRFTWVVAR